MSSNLHEFVGMLLFVTSTTIFVVGLRWAIHRLDNVETRRHRTVGDKSTAIKKSP